MNPKWQSSVIDHPDARSRRVVTVFPALGGTRVALCTRNRWELSLNDQIRLACADLPEGEYVAYVGLGYSLTPVHAKPVQIKLPEPVPPKLEIKVG